MKKFFKGCLFIASLLLLFSPILVAKFKKEEREVKPQYSKGFIVFTLPLGDTTGTVEWNEKEQEIKEEEGN